MKKPLFAVTVACLFGAPTAHAGTARLQTSVSTASAAATSTAPAIAATAPTATTTTATASVNFTQIIFDPGRFPLTVTWKCVRGDGVSCTRADLANPWYRQVVILPTGYAEADRSQFWTDFERTRALMTGAEAGTSWSVQKRGQLLFVGYFIAGGPIGAADATFGGAIPRHPIRGYALSLRNADVYARIDAIKATIPELRPMSVGVVFNSLQAGVTANAAPPSFIQKPYGVAKFNRKNLDNAYVPTHELAHAGLNFLDEYVEPGLENTSIRQMDILTPLALLDGSWDGFVNALGDLFNVYDINISEILANNGNVNVALSTQPATVSTPGYAPQTFALEGGMFFGRGTYHATGSNLMNSGNVQRGPGDDFAYAHSPPQQQIIETAFGAPAQRPNDRLRNAGPINGWSLALGSTTHIMMFDGDKLNPFQRTQRYDVQVGWYDRQWHTCWAAFVPYPCYDDVWTVAQKGVTPSARSLDLRASSLFGLASFAVSGLCAVGINEISTGSGGSFHLCEQSLDSVATAFLPTVHFTVPYQDTDVPASQWLTTYWWRFRTDNGTVTSGWTGWSSFYRSL